MHEVYQLVDNDTMIRGMYTVDDVEETAQALGYLTNLDQQKEILRRTAARFNHTGVWNWEELYGIINQVASAQSLKEEQA